VDETAQISRRARKSFGIHPKLAYKKSGLLACDAFKKILGI
jgi:hypothetical protein